VPKKKNQSSQDSSSPAKKIDETTRYAEDVKAGRIIAGAPVRLACIRHLEDIKNQKQTGLDWRFETAQKAMEFFSEMLTVEVRNEVKPFNLEPFQRFIVGSIFGWYNADGTRRGFSSAVL
jgi:phage terminase large subunit-like protein